MSEKLGPLETQLVKWISIHHFRSDLGVFSCEKHQEPTKIHKISNNTPGPRWYARDTSISVSHPIQKYCGRQLPNVLLERGFLLKPSKTRDHGSLPTRGLGSLFYNFHVSRKITTHPYRAHPFGKPPKRHATPSMKGIPAKKSTPVGKGCQAQGCVRSFGALVHNLWMLSTKKGITLPSRGQTLPSRRISWK